MPCNSLSARAFFNRENFSRFRKNKNEQATDAAIVFYDHACPLCRRAMLRLKARDRSHRLVLLNINGPDFRADEWGLSYRDVARALHVLTAEKIWLVGMPAIRHVYTQVGLGWLLAPSGWPLLSRFAEFAYRYIAPNRYVVSHWLGWQTSGDKCHGQACGIRHG